MLRHFTIRGEEIGAGDVAEDGGAGNAPASHAAAEVEPTPAAGPAASEVESDAASARAAVGSGKSGQSSMMGPRLPAVP